MLVDTVGPLLLVIFAAIIGGIGFLVAIGFFISGLCEENSYYYRDEKKEKIIWGGIFSLGCLAFLLVGTIIGGTKLRDIKASSYYIHEYNIVTLERAGGVDGHFALGSGSISDTQNYWTYHETSYGYKLEKLGADYTYIKEDDSKTPSVYRWKESGSDRYYYTIYCPVGSIDKYVYSV